MLDEKRKIFYEKLEKGDFGDLITFTSLNPKADNQKLILTAKKDGRGWYYGVPKLNEEQKKKLGKGFEIDPRKTTITIKQGTEFNLTKEVDKSYWDIVKYHTDVIAMSLEDSKSSRKARFFIDIPLIEAREDIEVEELVYKAKGYVFDDTLNGMLDKIYLVSDINMINNSSEEIKSYLLKECTKRPKKIISLYESINLGVQLVVRHAVDTGIILQDGGVLKYNEHLLGSDRDSSVDFLQKTKNLNILTLLKEEVETKLGRNIFIAGDTAKGSISKKQNVDDNNPKDDLETLKIYELRTKAKDIGIEIVPTDTKVKIIEKIRNH